MGWLRRIAGLLGGHAGASGDAAAFAGISAADAHAADSAFRDGVAAFDAGDYAAAVRCFEAVVAQRHDDAAAHNYLGLAHLKRGELEDAADCFVLATHFRPAYAEAWYNLALAAQRRADHAEAVRCLEQAIAFRTGYAEAYNALGASVLALGDARRAIGYFEQAIALKPDSAHAHSNLGYVLFRELGEYERGAAHIKTALDLNRGDPHTWCNYSMVLSHEGRLAEAIAVCDQLLAAKPGLDEARLNRALAWLKLGHFAQAWPDYEARKRVRSNYIPRPFVFPEWRGEPLAGKSILVYAEQGLGDEIMFASCLPDLLARAERCVLECSPRLERLFRRSFPAASVHGAEQSATDTAWLARLGHIDFQVAIGSLPGQFRRQWSDFPQHAGYLRADPSRVAYWRERTAALGAGLKIGIAWRGGMASTRRELRSTRLAQWLPLLSLPACHFVSLQYGDGRAEVAALAGEHALTVHHWQEAIDDSDETAALIAALDLVVSVQTATVHLAGALGRPAWVLVPAVPEWRYLQSGDAMPWYPSVRLFRQQQRDEWIPVITGIAQRLSMHP